MLTTQIAVRTLSNHPRSNARTNQSSQGGFTLLEMVVAMVVLTIGLLGVAQAISYALMASNRGRGVTNSKMLVVSALEQMETLRNTGQLRSEEHTSELQSPCNLVCRLLLEKKKKTKSVMSRVDVME